MTTRKPNLRGKLFVGIAPVFSSGIVNLHEDEQPRSEQYQQSEKDIETRH